MSVLKLDYQDAYHLLARRLKEARELAGLTQVEVATIIRKSQSYVTKCETGEKRVDVIELLIFSRVYRRDPSFFTDDLLPLIDTSSTPKT
jgi:transcriptional regulator with XRE-family HTH domain